jgi:hypothetical protein
MSQVSNLGHSDLELVSDFEFRASNSGFGLDACLSRRKEGPTHLHGLQNYPNSDREQKSNQQGPGRQYLQGLRRPIGLSPGDPMACVHGEEKPHVKEKDFQAGDPIRDRPAACASPLGFPKGQAEITGNPLQRGNYRVKARQEMKTVVGQPHAEPKRDQRKGKARGHL